MMDLATIIPQAAGEGRREARWLGMGLPVMVALGAGMASRAVVGEAHMEGQGCGQVNELRAEVAHTGDQDVERNTPDARKMLSWLAKAQHWEITSFKIVG